MNFQHTGVISRIIQDLQHKADKNNDIGTADLLDGEITLLKEVLQYLQIAQEEPETKTIYAKMYAWLRQQNWNSSPMAVVLNPKNETKPGAYLPSGEMLDEEIMTAMGLTHDPKPDAEPVARLSVHPQQDGKTWHQLRIKKAGKELPAGGYDLFAAQSPAVATRTALEQYDLEQSTDYRKGYKDGRIAGYGVGRRHGVESVQPPAVAAQGDLAPCDPEVFKHGVSVGLFAASKEVAEAACVIATEITGRKFDWHYIAGRVHVKAAKEHPEQPAPVPTCEWHEDEDGVWETSCGQSWVFAEGGPEDNGMKFCHQCGKHLVSRPQNPEAVPVPTSERLPTEADADPWGFVLAFDADGIAGMKPEGWGLWEWEDVRRGVERLTHWLPTGLTRPQNPEAADGN